MSDSGIGFSVKRFVIFIVACAIIILVFEGMSDAGGSMIKGQVSRTTSKFHPEKNVEDRIKPAFVLEDKTAVASVDNSSGDSVADSWNAEDSCEQVIEGNDMLQFNLKEMKVSAACGSVTVTLKHTGVMAAEIMGHNWVLTSDADLCLWRQLLLEQAWKTTMYRLEMIVSLLRPQSLVAVKKPQ